MSERILKGVLHNAAEDVILITISDKVKTETLKKIYNILLDEEVKTSKNVGMRGETLEKDVKNVKRKKHHRRRKNRKGR